MRSVFRPSTGWRRHGMVATTVATLLAVTAQSAGACISHCVNRYGSIFKTPDGNYYELDRCTQYETMDGPVYITCYYV
ncbi:MAG TPA: hypothetical protein VHG91_12690 [Longimicrobium sp.]|nr:hypothetical protein [Longimicrobium sp.]